MERRDFLRKGSAATLAAALGHAGSAAGQIAPDDVRTATQSSTAQPHADLAERSVADLQRAMTSGSLTARAVAEAYLTRIGAVDRAGPALNSIIELNPDALAIAEALDRERREKGPRGPLHGIPVLVKDNIDTADRMRTSAGSLALAGSIAPRDAFVVEQLRAAGAVILGKTNLSEWANFRSTRSTSGWSSRGGQTRNPYALDRNPCGSSSGSGAAAAASLCAVAVGTETDGSIVCPSNACGLVGIKPTVGLVSRSGIIPISASQDTAGPMARTVADAAALLAAIAGTDPRDKATARRPAGPATDYLAALDPNGLKGARLGVVRAMFGRNPDVERVANEAIAALKALGAVVVDPVVVSNQGKYDDAEYEVLLYEFKDGLRQYFAALGPAAPVKSLAEVIAFNDANRERVMPYFGQEIMLQAEKKGALTSAAYRAARATSRRLSRAALDASLGANRLDALVAPTGDPAFPIDLVNGDHFTGGGSSTAPAVSGYPHLTVPSGFVHGLPVGLSFIGKPWSEATLIRLAFAFEQATKARRPPEFRPSVGVPG
jgi:amidase